MSEKTIEGLIFGAGLLGVTADSLEKEFSEVSRSTINRRIAALVSNGEVRAVGAGRSTRYVKGGEFPLDDIRAYLSIDHRDRSPVFFQETLLEPSPGIDPDKAARLVSLNGRAKPLDRQFLKSFLIDFSWGSSVLEGGSYSDLDTQALIEYGQKNNEKPIEDALLILAHKNAIEFLWANQAISEEVICGIHAHLTDNKGIIGIEDSDHFLSPEQQGRPREYEDVNINRAAYVPPFRPGTGFVKQAFSGIVKTAQTLPPVESAFYLMTRLPYLQVFANGNKRTSRLSANLPLIGAGLLPISFTDIHKPDYIQSILAFYELGNTQLMEKMFIDGYVKSIYRGSQLSATERIVLKNPGELISDLTAYVQGGKPPNDPLAKSFIQSLSKKHEVPAISVRWEAKPAAGFEVGIIKAVSSTEVVMDAGKGRFVVWDRAKLTGATPISGKKFEIEKNGVVSVARTQSKGKGSREDE